MGSDAEVWQNMFDVLVAKVQELERQRIIGIIEADEFEYDYDYDNDDNRIPSVENYVEGLLKAIRG